MKVKILTLLAAIFLIGNVSFGQGVGAYKAKRSEMVKVKKNNLAPQRQGFYVMPEVGVGLVFDSEYFTWNVQGIFGYEFNNYLSIGIGTGLTSLELYDNINIPLFVNIRGDITKKDITPYYSIDCGYSLCLNTDGYFQEGVIISPELGIRIRKYYIGCEFLITEYHREWYDYYGYMYLEDYATCNLYLKFGYRFH